MSYSIKFFVVFILSTFLLSGCGGGGSNSGGGGSDPLLKDMADFLRNPADQAFFAKEAQQAGVTRVRLLEPTDVLHGVDDADRSRVCGFASPDNERTAILIGGSGKCLSDIHTLMGHEISHFGVGNACNATGEGHGPPFWAWFRGLATRYGNEVPDGDWNNPFGRIASSEQGYVDRGTRLCKDNP